MSWYIHANNNEQGLSLVEVLTSLILLSLLTISVITIYTPAGNWIRKARFESTASNYAASILEALRADHNKLDKINSGKTAQELFPDYGYPWPGMTASITRIEPQSSPYTNLYDVTVIVTWPEGMGTRSLQLSTIMKKE